MAELLLSEPFEPLDTPVVAKKDDKQAEAADQPKGHYIEDATAHFIVKKLVEKDAERGKKSLTSKQSTC